MNFRLGLVGYGYWGKNLLRNMIESERISKISVCDLNEDRLSLIQKMHPEVSTTISASDLIGDQNIDAIVIATPASSHYELAKMGLLGDKHVFIEKPATASSVELKELISIAHEHKKILMVDHTFLYNGAVHKIKEYIGKNEIGKLKYIDSTRINLGIYQNDVNVVWDLAIHDLSIIQFLINERPVQIRAIGQLNPTHLTEDLAYLFLYYPSGLLVQINCSWASPVKIRQMIIAGDKQMIIYDDIEPSQKIKLYEFSAVSSNDKSRQEALMDYRLGDISIPKFSTNEPLKSALDDYLNCISNNGTPISSAESALEIVQLIEKAEESLKENGKLITL